MPLARLHVFDFDGTLFRSPLPNPKNFSPEELRQLKDKGGWFHLPPSLVPPAVPEDPEPEWWIEEVKAKAEEALRDAEARVVLLTGRGPLFTERVRELTQKAGLEFHEYHLKPPGNSTLPWKCEVIRRLVEQNEPRELHIYEDRIRHVEGFRALCAELSHRLDTHAVTHVTQPERYLEDAVEQEVVAAMNRLLAQEGETLASRAARVKAERAALGCSNEGEEVQAGAWAEEVAAAERGACDKLYVFDFDGTLFRSPLPNPATLDRMLYGRLRNDDGWFHHLPSLVPPAVPEDPEPEWWIEEVKAKAEEALRDPDARVVLLTGRGLIFADRVKGLTQKAGLEFHEYHLKPPGNSTLPWKCEVIRRLVEQNEPRELHIYEDREPHVRKFRALCADLSHRLDTHAVVHVAQPERHLPPAVEQEVISAIMRLRAEAGRPFDVPAPVRGGGGGGGGGAEPPPPVPAEARARLERVLEAFMADDGAKEMELPVEEPEQRFRRWVFDVAYGFPQLKILRSVGQAGPVRVAKRHAVRE